VILDKAQILGADDLKIETVPVPEWGGTVCVRNLRGWERDKFDQDVGGAVDKTHARAKLVSMALCDKSGASLGFTEEDAIALSDKSAAPLDRLFVVVCKSSGIGKQDVEELEKNLPGQNESSGAS
jgi:ApbE superfamily uncharacterized protein (UPF0280 family)